MFNLKRFMGPSGLTYVSNWFKRMLDENFSGLASDILVLEEWKSFKEEGAWYEMDVIGPTPCVAGVPILMVGSIIAYTLKQPAVPISLPTNVVTSLVTSGDRYFEAHCLLEIEGTAGDTVTITARDWMVQLGMYVELHSTTREIQLNPGPLPNTATYSFYATTGVVPGDRLEIWCTNDASNDVTLGIGSTVRIRPT